MKKSFCTLFMVDAQHQCIARCPDFRAAEQIQILLKWVTQEAVVV